MADAGVGGAAHREADLRSRLVLQRHRHGRLQRGIVRHAGYARLKSADRADEPFEVVEAVRDEIADHAAAIVAAGRFPVAHAHLDGAALDVPVHGDVTQGADASGVEHLLGAQPGGDPGEVEIDAGRQSALLGRRQHGLRAGQIAGHRLLGEHRLSGL